MTNPKPNTSSAVMQQRNPALDAFDDFPTPMWATRALIEYLRDKMLHNVRQQIVEEPCANRGYMVHPLAESYADVWASDIYDYGVGFDVQDYLFSSTAKMVDSTICNPPFVLAEEFIELALRRSHRCVAVFVRSAFAEGIKRHETLFSRNPPSRIVHFAERVIIHKGIMRDPEVKYWAPKANKGKGGFKRPSSATAYCWMIWDMHRVVGVHQELTETDWFGKCRKRLECPDDYDLLGDPSHDK